MGSVETTRSRTRNAPPLSGTSRVKRTFRSRTLAGMQYITGLMELLLEISPVGVDDDF